MFFRDWPAWGFSRTMTVVLLSALMVAGAAARSGNYLIITAPAYDDTAPLNEFIAWKTAQGFDVMTYSVPTGTSRTAIKDYILNLWGTPEAPDYILIVGDTDGASSNQTTIPHWVGGGSKSATTDLPYGCMDAGDDWQPEACVGRFSVRNTTQLQAMVDKTLQVEARIFSDPTYTRRAAMLAASDLDSGAHTTHDWVIANYIDPVDYDVIRIYSAEGGNTADITAAVNSGCVFTVYGGHSTSTGWWDPAFSQSNVQALSNDLYGLAYGWSCNSAHFDYAECFGETWIREANKGAAAYLSSSTTIYYGGSSWEVNRRLEKYFFESFFVDNVWEVGPAWQAALYRLLADPDYGAGDVTRNCFEMYVLLGDPSLLLPQPDGFSLEVDPVAAMVCAPPTNQVAYDINVVQIGTYTKFITLSAAGLTDDAVVAFSVNNQSAPYTSIMTVSNLSNCDTGNYDVDIIASSTDGREHVIPITLSIARDIPGTVSLVSPPDGAVDVSRNPTLSWQPATQAAQYDLEVATDAGFANVVYTVTMTDTDHTVDLRLDAEVTYFWHVRATNGCGDSDYSVTYEFTTLDQADYFTEQFTSGFDLENFSVHFTPNGSGSFYGVCGADATEFPVDPTGGTNISLSEDGNQRVYLSGGESVQLYGVAYDSFYICDNGYLTFTGSDSDWTESIGEHFSMPRVSALYNDLSAPAGGTISWKQIADRAVVTYQNVPEYNTSNNNTFQVELFFDGQIRITWLTVDSNTAVVGLSAGGGIPDDFLEYDLSAAGPCTAICCHGYVCYDLDPADTASITECLEAGGTYLAGLTCAEYTCDCGGSDYRGDANCLGDGVDAYDINGFILAVGAPAEWMAAHSCNLFCANDINCDGEVNAYDIDGFIACVGAGVCESCP